MKPKSFDIDTAREIVGDARTRVIEAKARADAEAGIIDNPQRIAGTYWGGIQCDMEYIVYDYTRKKRTKRMARIKEKNT